MQRVGRDALAVACPRMKDGSRRAIVAALLANLGIARSQRFASSTRRTPRGLVPG